MNHWLEAGHHGVVHGCVETPISQSHSAFGSSGGAWGYHTHEVIQACAHHCVRSEAMAEAEMSSIVDQSLIDEQKENKKVSTQKKADSDFDKN